MTHRDDIRDRLQTVFRETFDDDAIELSDAMTAEDLEDWDSVSHISLVLAVERAFGVTLNAAEIGSLENVGAMIALLRARKS